MLVKLSDGKCWDCEGQLEVVDADDCSMTVVCTDCGEYFTVEPDAFGDGCAAYYIPFMTDRHIDQGRGRI